MSKNGIRQPIPALVILFGILAIFIVVSGFLYYQIFRSYYTDEVAARLGSVAAVKASQVSSYLKDRVTEGEILRTDQEFSRLAGLAATNPDNPDYRKTLDQRLISLMGFGHYDSAVIVNADGDTLYAFFSSQPEAIAQSIADQLAQTITSSQVLLHDLYTNPANQRPTISVVIPLLSEAEGERLVLLLQIDVVTELYPAIDWQSGSSESGQSYLMANQQNEWFLLGPALISNAVPLSETVNPEATALLLASSAADQNTTVDMVVAETNVIAYGSRIQDSNLRVLVTLNETEAAAPIKEMLWLTMAFMSALLIVVAAAVFGTLMETIQIRRKDAEINNINAELERFTYTVTHDLKSPVVTIKTFLNFMLQDIKAQVPIDQIEKNATYIRNAADRMSRLLDELLRMSLLGHQDKPISSISYKSLIEDVTGTVAGRLVERGVQLQISEDDILLKGDRSRFVELWQNLVENAVKYMGDQQAPRIHIGFDYRGKDIEFFVKDNGVGIAQEHHVGIFGIFTKLDSDSEGTGLGLAVVQKIVGLYNGRIWVESAGPGTGSTFRFTLPDAVRGHRKASGIRY